MRLALLLALAVGGHAETPAAGKLLVATPKSHDPDFARSVIVLIHYDANSAVGLMLNKPTDVPISDVLPEAKAAVKIYAGGPVAMGVRGLARSKTAPFFSLISNKPQLLKMISDDAPSSSFRIYAGYVGWTARQLQDELTRGLWNVLPANAGTLFDARPEMLWRRLNGLGSAPRP
jgi:putative transcriptional regulator